MRARTPDARFILMTNPTTARAVRPEVDALGPICFLEKPLDLAVLERVLRPELEPGQIAPPGRAGFSAAIHETDPISILQLKCLGRACTEIEFLNARGELGRVTLHNGDIIRAEAPGASGIAALAKMVAWKDGAAREIPPANAGTTNELGMGWEMALMEATRLADEGAHGA